MGATFVSSTVVTKATQEPSVHVCGKALKNHRHICAVVNSREEEFSIHMPFSKEGLDNGDKVIQIIDIAQKGDHAAALQALGADVASAEAKGQLAFAHWADAYLTEGRFDPEATLKVLESIIADRKAKGYPLSRVVGNMEWALSGVPGGENLLEYEARVNQVSRHHPDTFICVYDTRKFGASQLVDIIRTHPVVIMGGVIHENPFFVPPEQMLQEIAERKKDRSA